MKTTDTTTDTFEQIVAAIYGGEQLTESLIQDLVSQGWNEKDLREYAAEGCTYSRERNSIFGQPQWF